MDSVCEARKLKLSIWRLLKQDLTNTIDTLRYARLPQMSCQLHEYELAYVVSLAARHPYASGLNVHTASRTRPNHSIGI